MVQPTMTSSSRERETKASRYVIKDNGRVLGVFLGN